MSTRVSELQIQCFRLFFDRKGRIPYHQLCLYKMPSINSFWNNEWLTYQSSTHEFLLTEEGWRVGQRLLSGKDVNVLRKDGRQPISDTIAGDLPTSALESAEKTERDTKRRKAATNRRQLQKHSRAVARAKRAAEPASNYVQ